MEGIKADDGEGYYIPDDVRLADGRTGAQAAWALGGLHRECLQRALDEVHPGRGVLFGRSGWTGQQATGLTWGGDQASDFWSLRVLVVATLSGGLQRLLELVARRRRLPGPPAGRALPAGAARPLAAVRLLHAADAGARADAPGAVALRRARPRPVPRLRAAARAARALRAGGRATAARTGLPIMRPLCLIDPDDDARLDDHRRVRLRPGAVGGAGARRRRPRARGGAAARRVDRDLVARSACGAAARWSSPAPLHRIPVWVRAGSIVVTYPAEHVAGGLGDTAEAERPLVATLWGAPAARAGPRRGWPTGPGSPGAAAAGRCRVRGRPGTSSSSSGPCEPGGHRPRAVPAHRSAGSPCPPDLTGLYCQPPRRHRLGRRRGGRRRWGRRCG